VTYFECGGVFNEYFVAKFTAKCDSKNYFLICNYLTIMTKALCLLFDSKCLKNELDPTKVKF